MGKGDRRSRRGKLFAGTFGKTRPHKVKKKTAAKGSVKKSGGQSGKKR